MLVLDTTFSKQDVDAINHFVGIAVSAERERIIKLLEAELETNTQKGLAYSVNYQKQLIALIKGENK